MPKATTKSEPNHCLDKPSSSFDIALDIFLETGCFTLSNEIVTTELLIYFKEYLKKQAKSCSVLNYKFYLENVIFSLGSPGLFSQESLREAALEVFLNQIFSFSPKWNVIAFDKVTILKDENYYPLSSYFILLFLARFKVMEADLTELTITNALIMTNAEFHPWAWMRFLTSPSRFDSLTLELLSNEDREDNFLLLCEVLQYAKIKILNLGATEISAEGYHALNKLLDNNYCIEKLLLKAPTNSALRAISQKNKDRLLYLDHEKYLQGRWPLSKLDINQLMDNETTTVGHCLLENALERNDTFMVKYLINAGANLFEQRDAEKPFLIQIFEKNRDFKLLILNYIIYDKNFLNTTERVLANYPNAKEIIVEMENSLIKYAEILKKRARPYLLSDFERLLNLLKDLAGLSRPSKKRDQEFIEIYWSLFKCLILFHDALGRVTSESISNAQKMLEEIGAISENADWGRRRGSKLHHDLPKWIGLLTKNMDDIKELVGQANVLDEKDNLLGQQAPLKAQDAEVSGLDEPGPSTRFFSRR